MSDDAKLFFSALLIWIAFQGCSLDQKMDQLDRRLQTIESRGKP